MMHLKDRVVGILGLGRSGLALAEVLHGQGARVIVSDQRSAEALAGIAASLPEGVLLEAGSHVQATAEADLLVLSPGVPRALAAVQAAEADGVEVTGEVEMAYRLGQSPWIAITGTNGKTTTTSLIGAVLADAGLDAPVCGNIGDPVIRHCLDPHDALVVEVSSYQLETAETLKPKVAVFLNLTDDHLERHGSMEGYFAAKARLFAQQDPSDHAVLKAGDPWAERLAEQIAARIWRFSPDSLDSGVCIREGEAIWIESGRVTRLWSLADLRLRGAHNVENALAASAAALAMGIAPEVIGRAVGSFEAVPHRIETVRTAHGRTFVNDSKGTNYDSTVKAIAAFNEPLVLIAGGRDKGGDISPLLQAIVDRVRHTILIGEAAPYFARCLEAHGHYAFTLAADLADAVTKAAEACPDGGVILFSPACASFDMFRDYVHRGDAFREIAECWEP
ncbi:MAG: UDP-N-acetylmuramoyl-L-alanine--D-glutamate ligase [Candidatus Sericytochromatia bacterium]|nr:UDP-N-acetylmuramoyl-L-alanine--D-glutamate ligase [Candidatus Sericytochromatia bacterium]